MADQIAEKPKFEPGYIDPEVEPLDVEVDSKTLGSSGQSKVVGFWPYKWTVGYTYNMNYTQKSAALLMAKESSSADDMRKKLESEFGGSWCVYRIKGTEGYQRSTTHASKDFVCKGYFNFLDTSYHVTFDCTQE